MKNTTYFNFKKPELIDVVSPEDFNDNSDKLDKILYNSTRLEVAGGTANALTLTEVILEDKTMKNFIAKVDNDASVSTTINGKNVYRAGTTESPTFISGKAYCVWYDEAGDCFFTRANAEGDVEASQVLAGKYFSNDKDTRILGTMPNNPAINSAINCGEIISIPAGYTPGGTVKANSLASQTSATATANKVLNGYTFWKNGTRYTGNIPLLQAQTITPGTSNKTINPGKYINGPQTIKGDSNLIASNIIKGKSIFGVDGTAPKYMTGQATTYWWNGFAGFDLNIGFDPIIVVGYFTSKKHNNNPMMFSNNCIDGENVHIITYDSYNGMYTRVKAYSELKKLHFVPAVATSNTSTYSNLTVNWFAIG